MAMRITHSKNAADAKSYYSFSDYYDAGPDNLKPLWFGEGAKMLGLNGVVDQEQFERLIDNLHPFDLTRLTRRNHADRRVGTDITVSAPKSVSLLWAITQDDQILKAVQDAALEAFGDLEQDAQTRVNHERGRLTYAKTRNITGAAWLHTTARPIDGHADPQLHVHGFVINATNTGDDRWTALDLSAVVKDSGYYEAIFQSRLAGKLESLGYATERNGRDFEVAGVSRKTIDKFSRRTGLIEQLAADWGITDAAEKGLLGQKTREKKSTLVPPEQLPATWRDRLNEIEKQQFDNIIHKRVKPVSKPVGAKEAVDYAREHCFERESVIRERQLLRTAILQGIGHTSVDNIVAEVGGRDWIREGQEDQALISTREILAEEQAVLRFARLGRGDAAPLNPHHHITRDWLSDEQKAAVNGLLQSTDRLQIVRGRAGVGKTSIMSEAIEAVKHNGHPIAVLAPTAEAAYDVLRDKEGIEAETLAAFLTNEKEQSDYRGGVIWVDEAGLVGTSDLSRLVSVATNIDARVILSGDTAQHSPVSRGMPMQLLESDAGITPKDIKTIRRQKGEYREAVLKLSKGEVSSAMDKLTSLGFIQEIDDDVKRNATIARDYVDAIEAGQSSLVVAPAHAERRAITEAIRDELKQRGRITGQDRDMVTLRSKRLTAAQRSDTVNYEPGDIIEFVTKGKGGFKAGDRLTVLGMHDGHLMGGTKDSAIRIPIESPKSFDVYRPVNQSFAKGDLVRITKNRRPAKDSSEKRLNNGMLLSVAGFNRKGDIKLSNGQTLDASWGHLDHGVTITSYASQGKTYDRVFIAQSSLSFPASSPEQAYVSVSRGREQVSIYTDDKDALKAAVNRRRTVKMASELQPDTEQHQPDSEMVARAVNRFTDLPNRARQFAQQQLQRFQQWISSQSVYYSR